MAAGQRLTFVHAVAELARQVREDTIRLLYVPAPSWLTWSPPGTSNHILWHAGHALWLQDALTIRPLTNRSELPAGWEAKFGQNSEPSRTSAWPAPARAAELLQLQLDRIFVLLTQHAEHIEHHGNEPTRSGGWPLLAGMIHEWHDEARHQGEMYLLHKLCRASATTE